MNNPVSWDQVETLTEGLVRIAGWSPCQSEIGLSAELLITETKDHSVTFAVSEAPEFLEFSIKLLINFERETDADRFSTSAHLLHEIFEQESIPLQLKVASCASKSVVYEMTHNWKCDSELQQEITLPVLHYTIMRWSGKMSLPALSLAPLLGLYMRGLYKRDEDFVVSVKRSLGMITLVAKGHA